MKKVNHLTSLASILVISLLLVSIVCSFIGSLVPYHETRKTEISKKSDTASSAYTYLLCAEKEKEEETETESARPHAGYVAFVYIVSAPFQFAYADAHCPFFPYNAPRCFASATDVPLFLSKQTFLI